jgi:hypothetical protein
LFVVETELSAQVAGDAGSDSYDIDKNVGEAKPHIRYL